MPKVIDYACGAGHFLTEGISAISDAFKDHGFTGEKEMTDEEISASFYGVEKTIAWHVSARWHCCLMVQTRRI